MVHNQQGVVFHQLNAKLHVIDNSTKASMECDTAFSKLFKSGIFGLSLVSVSQKKVFKRQNPYIRWEREKWNGLGFY